MEATIDFSLFEQVSLHCGTIVDVQEFPKARKPAYKIWVDFGPMGIKQTSAQLTKRYKPEDLLGWQIIGVLNIPPRIVAGFESQFLLTGFDDGQGGIVLATVESEVPKGNRLI
ncbi:tRNA-binding protein [Bacteroidota bacterium]